MRSEKVGNRKKKQEIRKHRKSEKKIGIKKLGNLNKKNMRNKEIEKR